MDYEKRVKQMIADEAISKEVVEKYCPELKKESEDERIRKALIKYLDALDDDEIRYGVSFKDMRTWLEKQGDKVSAIEGFETEFERQVSHLIASAINREHEYNEGYVKWTANALLNFAKHELEKQGEKKHTDWSKEDEKIYNVVHDLTWEAYKTSRRLDIPTFGIINDWLKSLKDRVVLQPKQEWSEEDEQYLEDTLNLLEGHRSKNTYGDVVEWLKSLRPQNWTKEDKERYISCLQRLSTGNPEQPETINSKWFKEHVYPQFAWKPSEEHYELEEFAKIVRGNLTGISKAVQKLFEAKYLQLTGNKMYGGFKD